MKTITKISRFKRIIRNNSFIRKNILPKYWVARNYFRYSKIALKKTDTNLPNSNEIFWIDPKLIEYHTIFNHSSDKDFAHCVFDMSNDDGKVIGGDWDLEKYKFQGLKIFKAIKSRIEKNINWETTDWYKELLSEIENGYERFGCINQDELNQKCFRIDSLIESIKEKGFLSHADRVENYRESISNPLIPDEITANIGRDGKYLFQNGRHRLSIAIALGIESIPIKVLVRHTDWVLKRNIFLKIASNSGGELYQPALHPDLEDIPYRHDCEDRFNKIKDHIPNISGTLLDVGSYLGYFCHKFEDLGVSCTAIEKMPEIAQINNIIKTSVNRKFHLEVGDVLDPDLMNRIGYKFDTLLLLNIFHHFLKTDYNYSAMKDWLQKIETKHIIFEPHLPEENQMKEAYRNFDNQEFVNFIMKHTKKTQSKPIHKAADGRTVFLLT